MPILLLFCCAAGCAGSSQVARRPDVAPPHAPSRAEVEIASDAPWASKLAAAGQSGRRVPAVTSDEPLVRSEASPTGVLEAAGTDADVRMASHESADAQSTRHESMLPIEERRDRVSEQKSVPLRVAALDEESAPPPAPAALPGADSPNSVDSEPTRIHSAVPTAPGDHIDLNLPTALSMVGGQHPVVGFAQWRVQEAYAQLEQAEVLWLPSIQTGFSFHRHDGNYQASDGDIVDVNRNSFQYGLGAGATGAGTTPRPGLVAQFHLADAIFQPQIAEKTAWARGHAANGVINEQLLTVAVAYLELLDAHQDARILKETRDRARGLSKLTADFAATGQGLQADADRMETELNLADSRLVAARERIDIASARLAQALSIGSARPLVPLDPTVVPIELVSLELSKPTLIGTGLANRPELKESQALVAAACEQYRRQKYAPFVPSVLLGFSTGEFGGGLGNNLNDVEGRYDFDALMLWEVRNLGFGERSARREAASRIEQAKFEKIRVMDQVAREVSEAHAQVLHRSEQIAITQRAIESAENSYFRNLGRIRDGQGLPLEALQSVQALEAAQRAYLSAVMDYNEAQFRLQWALGWPVSTPAS